MDRELWTGCCVVGVRDLPGVERCGSLMEGCCVLKYVVVICVVCIAG